MLVDLLELVDGLLFMTEHLDDLLSRHHLLDEAVDTGETFLLGTEIGTAPFAKLGGDDHHHNGHHDADHRQGYAHHNHRGKGDSDGDGRVEDL